MHNKTVMITKRIALTATCSALLICGKFLLAFIPNVEVVTTLTVVFGIAFGIDAVVAAIIFAIVDIFLYPTTIDVMIDYIVYWPLLAFGAHLLSLKFRSFWVFFAYAMLMTVFFGIFTVVTYCCITKAPFLPWLISCIPFTATQMVSAGIFMTIGFFPIKKVLDRSARYR